MLKVWIPGTQDFSDQGNGGLTWTNHNTTINDSGKIGKCINFAGSQYLHVAEKIITSDKVSICFWINPVNVSYNKGIMNGRNANNQSFAIYMIGAAIRIDTGTNWSTGYELTANTWTHVAFVSDGTTQKLYINGVLNKNRTAAFDYSTIANYFTIGCEHINGGTIGTYFNGKLNDIRIYDDEVLSSKQVANIAKGLILHYPLSGPIEHQVFGDAIEDKATYLTRRTPGYNLINKLYSGGRTTLDGSTITLLLSQNADTYFYIQCSEQIVPGQKYTLSMYCSGFPSSDNYLDFGIIGQNSGTNIRLHNGYCIKTFSTASTTVAANTKIILDDLTRTYSGYQDVTVTNIKLEKGEVETPWIEKNSEFDQIVGGSVVWNQAVNRNNYTANETISGITFTNNQDGSITASGTSTSVAVHEMGAINNSFFIIGHKYYVYTGFSSVGSSTTFEFMILKGNGNSNNWNAYTNKIFSITSTNSSNKLVRFVIRSGVTVSNLRLYPQVNDLTVMFGPTIADYLYNLETSTSGAGIKWFRQFFPKGYYPYSAPTMKSVTGLISHNTTGFNLFDKNKAVNASRFNSNSISATSSIYSRSDWIRIIPNTKYYFKDIAGYSDMTGVFWYDADKTFISGNYISGASPRSGEFTSPANAYYVGINFREVNKDTVCLSISSLDNGTYEPYTGRSYALDSNVVLRGVWKLDTNDNNKLYCDGDVYSGDGSVSRRYGIVFGSEMTLHNTSSAGYKTYKIITSVKTNGEVFSNFTREVVTSFDSSSVNKEVIQKPSSSYIFISTASTRSINDLRIIFELDSTTTETATPFSNPQVCSIEGTEEYVIAKQDGVVIPAGHQTKYLHDVLEGRYHTYEEAVSGRGINDNIEYDVSGYQYNGTKSGATYTYIADTPKYNVSTHFTGTNYIFLPSPSNEIKTISLWVKWDTIPSGQSVVFVDYQSKLGFGLMSSGILCGTSGPGNFYTFSKTGLVANIWYHFVIVNEGTASSTTRKLYINSIEQTATSNTSNWSYGVNQLQIGKRSTTSDGFIGSLSDFRAYTTPLSASDVAELYNVGVATT